MRRESGVTAQGAGLAASPMQDGYTGTWDFTRLLSLSFCHTAHTALGVPSDMCTQPASGVAQQGGNVFLRDWKCQRILAAGSDAAVIPGSSAWLQAFSSKCDVLTTGRSARSASLALAGFVRVSVPDAMGPLPAVTQAGSLLVARNGSHVSLRWPSARETAFFQRMTTR